MLYAWPHAAGVHEDARAGQRLHRLRSARRRILPAADALRRLGDRRTGIGFDQALVLLPPRAAGTDVFYRIFNSDGSEVEQCGNGARCIASLVARKSRTQHVRHGQPGRPRPRRAASRRRHRVARHGRAEFRSRVAAVRSVARGRHLSAARRRAGVADRRSVDGQSARSDPGARRCASRPWTLIGPAVENHSRFPQRTNVGFMEVVGPQSHPLARVTSAASAKRRRAAPARARAVAVGRRRWGLLHEEVQVDAPGGSMTVRWAGPGSICGSPVRRSACSRGR